MMQIFSTVLELSGNIVDTEKEMVRDSGKFSIQRKEICIAVGVRDSKNLFLYQNTMALQISQCMLMMPLFIIY